MAKNKRHGKPQGMNLMDTITAKDRAVQELIHAQAQQLFHHYCRKLQQMCIDAAFMAANDVFHMGHTRCEAFGTAMVAYLHEMASLMNEDAENDPDIVYTKEKVDRRLRDICGEKFQPWEERYKDGT